jgi:hypothetical protein
MVWVMQEKHLRGRKYKPDQGESWSPTDWAFLRLGDVLAEIAINEAKKSVESESLTESDRDGGVRDGKRIQQ